MLFLLVLYRLINTMRSYKQSLVLANAYSIASNIYRYKSGIINQALYL